MYTHILLGSVCKLGLIITFESLAEYVQIKPVLAVITIVLKATGTYADGQLKASAGYTYVSLVYNVSVTLSLYCLAMFWMCTAHDLKPFRCVAIAGSIDLTNAKENTG